jgi:penicillin-binding protein 1A
VLLDARTGDVRAWVGGRSFDDSRFDRISQGFRQPGSAFKPLVWAAAIERGVALTDTFIDEPMRRQMPAGDVWEPRNFDGRFRGPVSVRNALRWSVNTVAVRLAERAGLDEVSSEARRMGITAKVPELPSVAIGAAALRPLELVRAYTAFATLGTRVEPRFVTRVENAAGEVLWEPGVRRRRVLDPGVAFLVTDAMRDVVDRGTGRKARDVGLRGPAAGKTGTTNGATDAWFVGFTPDVVGAVWIGFDRGRPITARGSGGELAAPVWGRMVRAAANGRVPAAWEPPGGVVERKVAVAGLKVISPGCRARGASFDEYFLRRAVPPSVCPRGAPDAPAWWERAAGAVETEVREWVREQSARVWRDVRRRAGFPIDGSAPRAEQSTRPRREEPEAREPQGVADPVTPGPRDSIYLPPVQVDTISL